MTIMSCPPTRNARPRVFSQLEWPIGQRQVVDKETSSMREMGDLFDVASKEAQVCDRNRGALLMTPSKKRGYTHQKKYDQLTVERSTCQRCICGRSKTVPELQTKGGSCWIISLADQVDAAPIPSRLTAVEGGAHFCWLQHCFR